ncbi:MAG TPA: YaiO family outer membrane beta-barrel protein, partial [Pontibacter sp.]
ATIGYSRQTAFGPVTGRISHANRYGQRGWQVEAEAYPKLSKTFYAYTSIGYSNDLPVFPKVRAGLSLFANLPHAWEAEGGIRYLNFDQAIWSYTLSAGKYFSNFWINGRTYLSQGNSSVSQSYSLTTRYYLKGADNYVSFVAGWGISPDDRSRAVRLNTDTQLDAFRVGVGYRFAIVGRHIISVNGTYENVEYLPETKDHQFNIATAYQFRF